MKKLKLAYCIICHKNTDILKTCIELLSEDENNDIYIHVDKKSDINLFNDLKIRENIKVLKNRHTAKWGDYSLIKITLTLLNETLKKQYDYVSLISGDDLPLKSNERINKILNENYGKEFIGINSYDNCEERLKYNYSNSYKKRNKNILDKIIVRVERKFKSFRKNKYFKGLPVIYKGSQWFTLTFKCVKFIIDYLNKNPNYEKAFYKAFCGDEIFFQTILYNSPFKINIYKKEEEIEDNKRALRYIDWKKGPKFPKILNESDYFEILKTDCIFARKFDSKINVEEYKKIFKLTK